MQSSLRQNLRLYGWVRMLSARVYLPLIAIYVADVGRLNFAQIGSLTIIAAVVSLFANVPTGYFADRRTRRAALMLGGVFIVVSTLWYALAPSYWGAILATVFDSLGYSFLSGAGEALVHDTLVQLNRAHDYVKVVGRAQSFSMIGNVVLVGLVPLTYALDKRIPFLCGTISASMFIYLNWRLQEPPRPAGEASHRRYNPALGFARALRQLVNRHTLLLFGALGFMNAVYIAYVPFMQLAFKDLRFEPSLMGLMYGASSLCAAGAGWFLHYLRRMPLWQYALLDVAIGCGYLLAVGLTRSLPVAIGAFLINMTFWRLRSILYQDHLLRRLGHTGHKATLISVVSFFADTFEMWLPLVFATVVTSLGYYQGFVLIGLTCWVAASCAFGIAIAVWSRWPSGPASADQVAERSAHA